MCRPFVKVVFNLALHSCDVIDPRLLVCDHLLCSEVGHWSNKRDRAYYLRRGFFG
jgi:hypothetical protein